MTGRRRFLPLLALVVIWVVWGSTYLAIRVVVREMPPFAAACLRFGGAGVVLAAISYALDRKQGWPTPRQWLDYGLVGVLLLAGGNALVMWSERTIPSGIAALIVGTVPVWLVLLDGLRPGGQPGTPRVWAGAILGLVGVGLVAGPGTGGWGPHWKGIAALQFASVSWSFGALYAKAIVKRLPVLTASAVEMVVGALALFAESRLVGEDVHAFAVASSTAWGGLVYLAVFGSLVGFTAFAYCLNELPASTVGTYAYVNPVVAVLLGWLILGEPLSAGLLTGGALILVSVLLTTASFKPRPAPSAEAKEAAA